MVQIGDILHAKYRVEAKLGSGGMGTVVRARHLTLGSTVAIKMLRPEQLDNETSVARFVREAQLAATLRSPHTVRILDIELPSNGAPFIVMECLEGSDLGSLVKKEGPFEVARAVDVMLQILRSVGEAHAAGIIHRDLKPRNILLTNDGIVKVLDFGLAKHLVPPHGDQGNAVTRANVVLGSPRYMSPEQITTPDAVDLRADIWSLGATFYYLLAGAPPFADPTVMQVVASIVNGDAPRLRRARPDLPAELDQVVATCLAREPSRRYPDVFALREALNGLIRPSARHARTMECVQTPIEESPVTTKGMRFDMTLPMDDAPPRPKRRA